MIALKGYLYENTKKRKKESHVTGPIDRYRLLCGRHYNDPSTKQMQILLLIFLQIPFRIYLQISIRENICKGFWNYLKC